MEDTPDTTRDNVDIKMVPGTKVEAPVPTGTVQAEKPKMNEPGHTENSQSEGFNENVDPREFFEESNRNAGVDGDQPAPAPGPVTPFSNN